eukprot:XP_017945248.1 PREDICTED: brefeldin A-inhibited guanine nucleotide-exchange protein 3-like [Xenopus tropicalis]
MGASFAPTYANLFMGWWERLHVFGDKNPFRNHIICFYRYIDDCIGVWEGDELSLQLFVDYCNSTLEGIEFTYETSDSRIPFLDVIFYIQDNHIQTDLYRKPITRNTLLHSDSGHPVNWAQRSPGFENHSNIGFQTLLNADGLYTISYYALLLNLKLLNSDYYRKKSALPCVTMKEFMKQLQSTGMFVFPQAWVEEVYHQVLERNLLGESGYWSSPEGHCVPLITMLLNIDGLGRSTIGGQLLASASTQSTLPSERNLDPAVIAGVAFARYILIGCWKNIIDTLSAPLTGRMAGSSKGLIFILGTEGVKEQNLKERDSICMSLDGLRKAARLSCALGVAANCASALAQMAAASCVKEVKDEKENLKNSDAITQVKQKVEQKLEQMGKQGCYRLHPAHVLCMDSILKVGLEMGSHNQDCWPHVFRVCEYICTLEHTHFSDGMSQPSLTITQSQQLPSDCQEHATDCFQDYSSEQEGSLSKSPILQPVPIQELIKEGAKGGTSLMSGSNAAKAVCTLSTEADKLFEGAADQLNLMALNGFLYQLKKASQAQLFHLVTNTVHYSLAMPGLELEVVLLKRFSSPCMRKCLCFLFMETSWCCWQKCHKRSRLKRSLG